MAGCPRPLLVLLAAMLVLPTAAAGSLQLTPDPLPQGTPLTVTARFGEPVEDATLRVCHATEDRTIAYCLTAQPMDPEGDATWTATTPRGFPSTGYAGVNVTASTTNMTRTLPADGSEYTFVPLTTAEATAPAPRALLVLAGLLLAVLPARRWLP